MILYCTLNDEDMKKLNNGEEVELLIRHRLFEECIPGLKKIIFVKEKNFNTDGLLEGKEV